MIFKLFFFWYYFAVCLKYILAIVRKVDYVLAILRKVDYVLLLSCENRILQWGEDCRFDEMRNNLGKLAVFWIFQVSSEFTTPFFFWVHYLYSPGSIGGRFTNLFSFAGCLGLDC